MYIEAAAGYLGVSVVLYAVFGGADFGAGMLEAFLGAHRRAEQRDVITEAMGPVWEANHIWLIIALVVLFNGFPRAFSTLSVAFHLPLIVMLLGIVLRGCSFTFRHYDTHKDQSHAVYSALFAAASFLTPFMLGVVAGGMMLGRVGAGGGYLERYVLPWASAFSAAVGLFVCALFAFLAAVYLVGETEDAQLRGRFAGRAKVANGLSVGAGGLVFLAAQADGFPLVQRFLAHPASLACMVLATAALAPLWVALSKGRTSTARVLAASQVALVLGGWFALQYPVLIAATEPITLASAAAPDAVLRPLLYALIAGTVLVLPVLVFLLRVFKMRTPGHDG